LSSPRVTVIVPVHDTKSYLDRCFGSVWSQTLGRDAIQVIAVDDGSTDGSGAWLDHLVAERPEVTVFHEPASGGPGKPRNTGMAHARGDYLFFLDSDDYLGPEALERMVAMADQHGSDVVYGRIVGVGGRDAPVQFRVSQPKADLFNSPVYWTLAPYKLFRRALVERLGLWFSEGRMIGEDQPFSAHALLHAGTISIVADHDCYFLEGRGDGTNATLQVIDWPEQFHYVEQSLFGLIAEHVPAGPDRSKLLHRHFYGEVLTAFGPQFLELDTAGRTAMAEAARGLVDRWLNDAILAALPPRHRLRATCIRRGRLDDLVEIVRAEDGLGPPIVEKGRAYAAYPFFRDPQRGFPDALYDITSKLVIEHTLTEVSWNGSVLSVGGTAGIRDVDTAGQRIEVVLRHAGHEIRFADSDGRFAADIDLATAADGKPVPPGLWGVDAEVTSQGITKRTVLGMHRADSVDTVTRQRLLDFGDAGPTVVTTYYAGPYKNLTFDVGETRHTLGHAVRTEVTWPEPGRRAQVTATFDLPGLPAKARPRLLLRQDEQTLTPRTKVSRTGDSVTVTATVSHPPGGTWFVVLAVTGGLETYLTGENDRRLKPRFRRPLTRSERVRRRLGSIRRRLPL
jgi:poly(ribitol-phosphate) beta-N-acetylglucosaminyltransferase